MEWERMDKPLRDLLEIIHFTESVSAKIHGLLDGAEIYRTVREELTQSKRYTASILLLTDDGSKLGIAETSIPPRKLKAGEKAAGVRLKGYKIDLNKSSIYSQVIREGKTVQVNVSDIVDELFPRPLAHLISKTMGYEKKPSILTPLKLHGKIIGVLAISSTELAEHFIPSVRNFAQHISNALELADEYSERKWAEEELRKYRDHLEDLVEKRTAELMKANEQLQREITERKRAEEALRESEERLKILFEFAPDAYYLNDLEGRFIDGNKAAEELAGYQKEELIGKSLLEEKLLSSDQVPKAAALLARNALGQATGPDEFTLNRRDGTCVTVEIR
jgi:PAS domain S-box-containing protein